MKKIAFLSLIFITYYLAGMYQQFPLMLLAVTEMVLGSTLFFVSRYLKGKIDASFSEHIYYAESGEEFWCSIKIHNSGKLAAARFQIRIGLQYLNDHAWTKKKLAAGSSPGEETVAFGICPKYCGLLYTDMEQLKVYDYLALFAAKKEKTEVAEIVVFPQKYALQLQFSDLGSGAYSLMQDALPKYGQQDTQNEIRQIREYRIGDLGRHIHWNLSARTQTLWTREYERENDPDMDLVLDLSSSFKVIPAYLDGFYRVLSALLLGMLKKPAVIRVHWKENPVAGSASRSIQSEKDIRELLLHLYQIEVYQKDSIMAEPDQFMLNLRLCWFRGHSLIHQFSREHLEEEIREKIFKL